MTSKQLFILLLILNTNVSSVYGFSRKGIPIQEIDTYEKDFFLLPADEVQRSILPPPPPPVNGANTPPNDNNNQATQTDPSDDELEFQPTWGLDLDEIGSEDDDLSPIEKEAVAANGGVAKDAVSNKTVSPKLKDEGTQTDQEPLTKESQSVGSFITKNCIANACLRKGVLYAGGTAVAGSLGLMVIHEMRSCWQRHQINKVLHKYDKDLSIITPAQARLMVAAYNHDHEKVHVWLDQYSKESLQHDKWIISAISDFYCYRA
jgi:hypothetical protein